MMRAGGGRRPGFSLIEMIAVIAGLTVATTLGTVILIGAFQVERSAAATLQRVNDRAGLADLFRDDVSTAVAAPESLGDVKAGPTFLLLRQPDGSHVVYRWIENHLERGVLPETAAPRPVPLGMSCDGAELLRGGPGQRLITLRLQEAPGPAGIRRAHDISAALGGDRP
jgi:hypothetical protein